MESTSAAIVVRACTGRRIRPSMRSLACCSGRWKCGAKRPPLAATSPTISGVQSIGSSELIRNVTSAGDESSARRSETSELDGVRSRPYEPRCTPVSAISLKPAAATRSTSREDAVNRQAAAGAARRRDDAVAASLLASGLHAQRERRAAGDARLDRRAAGAVAVPEPLGGRLDEPVLLVIPDHADDVRQRGDLVRPPRGVTAGHHDFGRRVVASDAPDRLARALIGARGHRAGVDDDEIGVARRRPQRRRARADLPRSAASRPG